MLVFWISGLFIDIVNFVVMVSCNNHRDIDGIQETIPKERIRED